MLTVANGRAVAFFMDDILLASLVATEHNPDEWMISKDTYTVEPYAIMEPKTDSEFKKAVDGSVAAMLKEGTLRSEERRVGKECVSQCRSRWPPHHQKKKKTI